MMTDVASCRVGGLIKFMQSNCTLVLLISFPAFNCSHTGRCDLHFMDFVFYSPVNFHTRLKLQVTSANIVSWWDGLYRCKGNANTTSSAYAWSSRLDTVQGHNWAGHCPCKYHVTSSTWPTTITVVTKQVFAFFTKLYTRCRSSCCFSSFSFVIIMWIWWKC